MNNVTFIILEAICCPKWESFVNDIASNGSDVAIVSIICLTVCGTLLTICFKMFAYLKERSSSDADEKAIYELNQQIAELKKEVGKLLEEKTVVEKKCPLPPEQKEEKRFLEFCYEMAKSTAQENRDLKKECWGILKESVNISPKKQEENGN